MCGILAVLLADSDQHAIGDLVDGMTALQHRGQDASGFTTVRAGVDPTSSHPALDASKSAAGLGARRGGRSKLRAGAPRRFSVRTTSDAPRQACTAKAWEKVTFKTVKKLGMVRDAFESPEDAAPMKGNVGIAHVRYPTVRGGALGARRG